MGLLLQLVSNKLFGPNQSSSTRLFLQRNADQIPLVALYSYIHARMSGLTSGSPTRTEILFID